ncbi:MAG: hypothetical protein Q9217_003975 [Psora testacea]
MNSISSNALDLCVPCRGQLPCYIADDDDNSSSGGSLSQDIDDEENVFLTDIGYNLAGNIFPLNYDETQKGVIASKLNPGFPCTTAHLDTVKNNLYTIKMLCAIGDFTMYESFHSSIAMTEVELLRLQQHPDLFPNEEIREGFWRYVHDVSSRLARKGVNAAATHDHEHNLTRELRAELHQAHLLPTRDPSRKPWEQFLHNIAPGIGFDLSTTASEGSTQVLPHAGYRIITRMNDENKTTIHNIEAVRDYNI